MDSYATCWSVKVGVGARPPAEVGPDVPLTLREAVVLPELGGRFSAKQLRTAIGSGALAAEEHGGTLYITRAGVRAWREAAMVRVAPKPKPSVAKPRVAAVRDEMVVEEVSLDAALMAVRALRPAAKPRR